MNVIEVEAKTKDQALEKASEKLNIPVYELKYEIIEEEKGGLFGIKKNVKLRILYNQLTDSKIEKILKTILEKMGIDAQLDLEENDDKVLIRMTSDDAGILIGKQGKTLESLQYIINIIHGKEANNGKKIVLDIESYRKKREVTLKNLAKTSAKKVIDTGKTVALEPMNPYERRIVHLSLQDNNHVYTKSEGSGLYKSVKIYKDAK